MKLTEKIIIAEQYSRSSGRTAAATPSVSWASPETLLKNLKKRGIIDNCESYVTRFI